MARAIARDHDEKRAQILKSAARFFATEGFHRASMSRIAAACGFSKANLYHYYDSKDALLFDMLDAYLSGLCDRICGLALDGLSPRDQLHRAAAEILRAYQGADHEHRVQITALDALPRDRQDLLRAYQRDLVGFVRDIVAGLAPGAFADDPARLRATTMSVFGMLNWYFMWGAGQGARARDDYAALVADLTLRGVTGLANRAQGAGARPCPTAPAVVQPPPRRK